jgi:plastocyanin domain-containing protein
MRALLLSFLIVAACKQEPAAPPAPAKPATPPAGEVAPQGRRIDIAVTRSGYTPDRVELKAGEQVTLVFTRTENTECGAEVQVPSINVKEQLPLNQPVAIPFRADKPGEVRFACGMDMMQGTLVVL